MSESVASEAISAMIGGMFSASALYPLEVLKTRMQAETKLPTTTTSTSSSDGNGNDEGSEGSKGGEEEGSNPNEGKTDNHDDDDDIEINTNSKATFANSAASSSSPSIEMQTTQATIRKAASKEDHAAAAVRNKRRIQYSAAAYRGMAPYATLMYRNEGGMGAFYGSGVATSAVQSMTEKALYFFAYTFLKNGRVFAFGLLDFGFCIIVLYLMFWLGKSKAGWISTELLLLSSRMCMCPTFIIH